jgi:predicted AlkP superfamily pyrophosphatase or phosphodiesterase
VIKAILILIDGCRGDALEQASTPTIDEMIDSGAHTFQAHTVTPSFTLPVHFSIFTSLSPLDHGVLTNTGRPDPSPSAHSIIDVVKYHKKTTAAFYSWEHLRNLSVPGSLDYAFYINTAQRENGDLEIAEVAADILKAAQPDFCFVYLEWTDIAGHAYGWMSKQYMDAIERADRALGLIMKKLESSDLLGAYNIIVLSDHGGIGTHHEKEVPEVMSVPWIAVGPSIKQGYTIEEEISVLDTAPTLAGLLGLYSHHTWKGKKITEIFKEETPTIPFPRLYSAADQRNHV